MSDDVIGEATARAPAHLSAFFVPAPVHKDPLRRGSKGAGVCLQTGVQAHVVVRRADAPTITVRRGPAEGPARVTEQVCRLLTKGSSLAIEVDVQEEVPAGQGFGVSAASALATGLALAKVVGKARSDAVIAAHTAEIQARTGLGDVAAATMGGVVVRPAAGLPPYGNIMRLPAGGEVVVCVTGAPVETKGVLSDAARMAVVAKQGEAALAYVLNAPNMERVFRAGRRFAQTTGIAPAEALEAVAACEGLGEATVAMIGSTVMAFGDTDQLIETLQVWGDVGVSPIADEGAHLMRRS